MVPHFKVSALKPEPVQALSIDVYRYSPDRSFPESDEIHRPETLFAPDDETFFLRSEVQVDLLVQLPGAGPDGPDRLLRHLPGVASRPESQKGVNIIKCSSVGSSVGRASFKGPSRR